MTLLWPWALLGLLLVPLAVSWLRRAQVRQDERRSALARQALVLTDSRPTDSRPTDSRPTDYPAEREVPPRRDRWRHVTPALLLASLTLLLVALARPVAEVPQPQREGTVVLAFDVSTSMTANDLEPTRLEAARATAQRLVDRQPASVRIGVVAFGGAGVVTERPTTDRSLVSAAVARLRPTGDTSLGQGLLAALSAIAGKPVLAPVDPRSGPEQGPTAETPIGYYGGTVVVLFSDGEDTGGPDPLDVAEIASAAGVRVETIGVGTPEGAVLEIDGFSIATVLDEALLEEIARTTGGEYRRATAAETGAGAGGSAGGGAGADAEAGADSLAGLYDSVALTWRTRTVPHEVTSLLAAAAGLLLLIGVAVGIARQGRVV